MGEGTTGVAALLEQRVFLGIEKAADYYATAAQAIAQIHTQRDLFVGNAAC